MKAVGVGDHFSTHRALTHRAHAKMRAFASASACAFLSILQAHHERTCLCGARIAMARIKLLCGTRIRGQAALNVGEGLAIVLSSATSWRKALPQCIVLLLLALAQAIAHTYYQIMFIDLLS